MNSCKVCGRPTAGIRHRFCSACSIIRRRQQWNDAKARVRECKTCPDCGGSVPKGRHYCAECSALRSRDHRRKAGKPMGYVMVPLGSQGVIFGIKIAETTLDEEPCAIIRLITTKAEIALPVASCVPITTSQLLKFAMVE